jgi:hypothetical protein
MGLAWVLADAQEASIFDPPATLYLARHRKPPRLVRAWTVAGAVLAAALDRLARPDPGWLPRVARRAA